MKTDFLSTGYLSDMAGEWEQSQRLRLGRLRQQRQRMGEMKHIVEQYSRIIRDLQLKNKLLASENERIKAYAADGASSNNLQFQTLQHQYLSICEELEKQRKMRYDCESTIQALRKQLTSPQISIQNPPPTDKKNELELNYQVLLILYEEVKNQVYLLEKENLTLKQVIAEQSRASYGKEAFWKQNPTEKNLYKHSLKVGKENRPGIIRNSSQASLKESVPKQESITKISGGVGAQRQGQQKKQRTLHETSSKKSRIRDLEVQIKKQAQIIEKYRESEGQQIKLIDLLKSQKTKVCACHSQGSSKKLTTSKGGIVSFKKDSVCEST